MNEQMRIWNNGTETMNAFAPFYQEAAVAKIREADALDSWFVLLQSAAADPAPLTLDQLSQVTPYAVAGRPAQMIDSALKGGFLSGDDAAGYSLTTRGRSALAAFFDTARDLINNAPVLPDPEMARLAALLQRIVLATEALSLPAQKPNLARSRWTGPAANATATVQVDQTLTDLTLFRDDAHIAAWSAYDIIGRSWETLTFLWRDDAHTATELHEKLAGRGYLAEDYAESLAYLAEKGWAAESADGWQITEAGRSIREEAELETDRIFFAGWDTLNEAELAELGGCLERLSNQLKEAAPTAEAA